MSGITYIWVKIFHHVWLGGYTGLSMGKSMEDVDKHLTKNQIEEIFGEGANEIIGNIVAESENIEASLTKYFNEKGWEIYPDFYRFNGGTEVEGICFKKYYDLEV